MLKFKPAASSLSGKPLSVFDRQYRPIMFLLLTICCILNTAACISTPPVIKIALVAPFEGEHRAIGYDAIYSARLAVREINNQGGINGHKVALVALDDGGDVLLAQETAVSLTLDPDVIAVVGHWRPDTSATAATIYTAAKLPYIDLGAPPFTTHTPNQLPETFKTAYAATTPFDEIADIYAGGTYDAFQLLFAALENTAIQNRPFNRPNMVISLQNIQINGITGIVYPNTHTPIEE